MTIWSSTIYQINPECELEHIFEILTQSDEEHSFGSHNGEIMSLYIDAVNTNLYGHNITAALDFLIDIRGSRRNPSRQVVATQGLCIQTLENARTNDLVIVYASH
ncbi:MAG: hypothetical protein ACTSU7_11410, partial [Candidatus Heimdallarchaeaceae archaeon]